MEQYKFPYEGRSFTVNLGGIDAPDSIEETKVNNTNVYKSTIHETKLNKLQKEVIVSYFQEVADASGRFVSGNKKPIYFNATEQENFPYFYNMAVHNVTLGTTFDKLVIDGALIEEYGLTLGIFAPDGTFCPPLSMNLASSKAEDGTFTIEAIAADGVAGEDLIFRLLETGASQLNNGTFTGLVPGIYRVLVESATAMPCFKAIELEAEAPDHV